MRSSVTSLLIVNIATPTQHGLFEKTLHTLHSSRPPHCARCPATPQALLTLQWQLGRGQIYDAGIVCSWLTPDQREYARAYTLFGTPDGNKFALDYALWQMLAREAQWHWLAHFISQDRSTCVPNALGDDPWNHIGSQIRPHVRQLAGSFAWSSGPNCFAITLAATTRSPHIAATIASLWLTKSLSCVASRRAATV